MDSTVQFRVRYQETDSMAVVHHSVYLIWFEAARTEWMRQQGFTYRECEAKGWLLPVVASGCRHIHSAVYDDLIGVNVRLVPQSGAIFRFEYTVHNEENGQLLASGFTEHVCVDRRYKIDKQGTRALKAYFSDQARTESEFKSPVAE